jgi:hydroxyacylglutathione hydrolase
VTHCPLLPGLLETGRVNDAVAAVRDGIVNLFVVKGPDGLLCIDAGWRAARISEGFASLGLRLEDVSAVLLTHLHWDHARGASLFEHAQVFTGACERLPCFLNRRLRRRELQRVHDGQTLSLGGLTVRVVATPGHTDGSVCYLIDDKWLFSGDALRLHDGTVVPFPAWFNKGNRAARQSLRKLASLEPVECLFTSHSGISCHVAASFTAWHAAETRLNHESVGR